ncbi:hypothetical protein ACJX0J_033801 [Zea mays]
MLIFAIFTDREHMISNFIIMHTERAVSTRVGWNYTLLSSSWLKFHFIIFSDGSTRIQKTVGKRVGWNCILLFSSWLELHFIILSESWLEWYFIISSALLIQKQAEIEADLIGIVFLILSG